MSYESAMEERILKTFKSKDDLIRKLQAEIEELKSVIEIMIQKAASKHRPAYDEQQECIMNMQTEIDELVEMNRLMWDRMGSVPKQYLISAYPDLFDKHKGE